MNYYTSEKLVNNFIIIILLQILLWSISIISDSLIFCYIASLFGFFTSFFYLLNFFNGKLNPMKFLQISSVFLILILNLSWLMAGYFGFIYDGTDLFSLLDDRLSVNHTYYLFGCIYVLIFSKILFLLSLNKKLINIENIVYEKLLKINYININIIIGIILITIALEFFVIGSGFIVNRTYASEAYQAGKIAYYIKYLNGLYYFHIAVTGFLLYEYKENKGYLKLIVITISIILLMLIFFSFGRGAFTFFFIQLLFWYCFFNKGLPTYRKLLPIVIFLIPFIFYLNVFNNFMRYSKSLVPESKNLLSTIFEVRKIFTETNLLEDEQIRTAINLSSRTLLVLPLAKSMELPMSQKEFFLGEVILNNLIWTIPRVIFPGKVNFLAQESLIRTKFKVITSDTADSLYFYSYVEFGYFGLLIYPILFFLYWKFIAKFIYNREFNPLILLYFASFGLYFFLTLSECGILTLTSYLRDMFILIIFLNLFFRARSKSFIASQKK